MKKPYILLLASALLLSSCGFFGGGGEAAPKETHASADIEIDGQTGRAGYKAAVILPDGQGQNWARAADSIGRSLEELGYGREVYFADGDAEKQAGLIRYAVDEFKADCVILAPVDSRSEDIISAVLEAKEKNVSIIAYDRLVADTDAIDCYIAYDPYLSGRLCALSVESALDFSETPTVEIILPGTADASAEYFYYGAMDVLLPQIDAGRISVPSGRISLEQTALKEYGTDAARAETDALLGAYYGPGRGPDAILTPDDALALGVIEALEGNGLGAGGAFPLVTGGGCQIENMQKMIEGKQHISLFKDEREIAPVIASAADYLIHGLEPEGADKTLYGNGNKVVPSFTSEPVPINIENYKELLIGGDYYSYKDLNL